MTTMQESKTPYKNWPNDDAFQAGPEERTPVELDVTGSFPSAVTGTLYRIGPSHYKVDTEKGTYACSHWFDGFTRLHRFQLIQDESGGCRVYYNSRGQVDELIEQARKNGNLEGMITFGQKRDPCVSFFQKVKAVFQPGIPDREHVQLWNVGVTVARNMPGMPADVLTSLTDANMIQHARMDTLEPVGVANQDVLHPDLKGPISCAHAQRDPTTGDMYSYNLDLGPSGTYKVFRTSAETSQTEILATISGPAAYVHSFFLSANYVILCVWPTYFTGMGASMLWERNVLDAMRFQPQAKTKWHVVDRTAGRGHVATFTSAAFFSFHTINAFEESSDDETVDVFCDLAEYPNDDVLRKLYYENIVSTGSETADSSSFGASLVRYKLSGIPKQGKDERSAPSAQVATTVADAGDLPTMNPGYAMKKQRFVYGVVNRGYSSFVDGLAKTDLETKEVRYWGKEPAPHTPGEAIFVPDGTDEAEDAGYLLSVVLDGEKGASYLVCLNARDMTEVARADYAGAIGTGFHGAHYGS